jgi:hypothetical protein
MIRSGLTSSLMSSDDGGGGGESSGTEGLLRRPSDADYRAYVYVVVMVVLGSTTAAAAKFVVRELPVASLPVVRFGVAGSARCPWCAGSPTGRRSSPRPRTGSTRCRPG